MRLIQSKAELLTQSEGLRGIYQMIELAGRTCYKSEANITYDSASDFVGRMIKSGHTAMLEHGTVYLLIPSYWDSYNGTDLVSFFRHNPYSKAWGPIEDSNNWHITTNYRVLVENNLVEKCKPYICAPTKYHSLRISMRFTTDRGVSHEIVRHRRFSFAQESTRFCNYNQDKFGNEITCIIPSWSNLIEGNSYDLDIARICDKSEGVSLQEQGFLISLCTSEHQYLQLLNNGCSPQQARQVLPNALKTEIVVTGFTSDWKHFFDLRYFGTTGKPHPDMLELTTKAKAVLEEAGLWLANS